LLLRHFFALHKELSLIAHLFLGTFTAMINNTTEIVLYGLFGLLFLIHFPHTSAVARQV
jgi:hypothetical protein